MFMYIQHPDRRKYAHQAQYSTKIHSNEFNALLFTRNQQDSDKNRVNLIRGVKVKTNHEEITLICPL